MPSIELRGVTKTFETKENSVTALVDVDLGIHDQELVAIVGASGCGKSTLLNLLAGFDTPTRGAVVVDNRQVSGPGPDRGVVFQQSALFPWLNVRENVAYGTKLAVNQKRDGRPSNIDQLLDRVGLRDFALHLPSQLSGGMRQRAAIAAVLAIEPTVLLMDEPFGALDSLTRSLMQDFLLELWEQNRKTMLLITHDITEAVYLADRLVVMGGRPGTIQNVVDVTLERPRHYDQQSSPEFVRLRQYVTDLVRAELADSIKPVSKVPAGQGG